RRRARPSDTTSVSRSSTRVSSPATRAFAASPPSPDIHCLPVRSDRLPLVDGPSVDVSCDPSDTNSARHRLILATYSLRTELRDQMGMGWIDGAVSYLRVQQARVHGRVRFLVARPGDWRGRRRSVV